MLEWDQLSEKEQLLTYISDEHKSAYGFRPRGQYDDWSVEDLRVELDRLNAYANEVYEEEQKHAEMCADKFDSYVNMTMATGAKTREVALKWILDAEEAHWDMEHFVYNQGFLFTDRGRALTAELWELQKQAA